VKNWANILLDLTKARITPVVTLSAATGHILFAGEISRGLLLPVLGVFILSCGCSALNQLQESRIDARMARTQSRPLPSGRVSASAAAVTAALLIILGLMCLASIDRHRWTLVLFGLFALAWYNGVYTYLKRVTAFAVVPGALVGAVPPMIGWAAAGGSAGDPLILLVAAFFFIWQIPHFWLLIMMRGEDYRQAGLPSPMDLFRLIQLQRITFIWIMAAVSAGLLVALLAEIRIPWNLGFLACSAWLVIRSLPILRAEMSPDRARRAFLQLIAYALIAMMLLCLDAVL
jgi:protoheme IX farnesyltransferase